ncbi:hypothetical protein CVT26_013626 [Gymnopilus dilepis]|uniref:Uncharacterized protein n=1 Tax=Gymnopilus dilepis TaxID=231916 RepID=A0A409Y5T8_9AGAR|nr:hypothetical protein CVT26_013626 [Gymnopilus dilepis]
MPSPSASSDEFDPSIKPPLTPSKDVVVPPHLSLSKRGTCHRLGEHLRYQSRRDFENANPDYLPKD